MKRIHNSLNTLATLFLKRDIFYIAIISFLSYLAHLYFIYFLPNLYSLSVWVFSLLPIAIISLIYLNRWYKRKIGVSLIGELLSLDREGGLFQLISRARKLNVDVNRNRSKGWNTAIDSDGVVLGKDENNHVLTSLSDSSHHIICFGGSGSGKTTSVLIPTALRFLGGLFCIDISGDIYRNVQEKRNIALLNPHSHESVAFNIFAEVDAEEDKSKKIILLKQLANLIIPEFEPTKTGDGVYFQQCAHTLFYAALIYYYNKKLDFCDICFEILNHSSKELVSLIKGKDSPPNAKLLIRDFSNIRDTNLASAKQQLDAYISVFATSRPVKRILHRPNNSNQKVISANELEIRDIFLCVPQNELTFFTPLMRLISGIILEYCSTRPLYSKRNILICLDEFSSLGFLDVQKSVATLRKYSTRLLILTQSLADIDNIYGITNRKILLDNCGIKIILGVGDYDSQEYFSKLVGTREVIKKIRTYSNGEARHTYTTEEKLIFSPEDFGYLRDDCIVLLPDGYLKLRKAFFYDEQFLL